MRSSSWGLVGVALLALVPWSLRAHTPVSRGDPEARIAYFSKRTGGATTYAAYAELGLAYLELGRSKRDLKYYPLASRHFLTSLGYQRNFDALLGLAMVCSDLHQFDKGLLYAEEALVSFPGHPDAEGTVFDLCLALGKTERATAIVNGMLERQQSFSAWSRKANLLELRGDLAGAIEAMQRARVEAHGQPRSLQAWVNARLALLFARVGNQARATDSLETAIKLQPDDWFAWCLKSRLLAKEGKNQEAMAVARRLVRQRGDTPARLLYYDLLATDGDTKRAEEQRRHVLEDLRQRARDGDRTELRQLAILLLDRDESVGEGLLVASDDWFHRQDPLTADVLGWAYFRNGRLDEAARLSARAMESGTQEPRALLHAGLIQQQLGRSEEAAALLESARSVRFLLSWDEQRRLDAAALRQEK